LHSIDGPATAVMLLSKDAIPCPVRRMASVAAGAHRRSSAPVRPGWRAGE
jgi:hypothetical protein